MTVRELTSILVSRCNPDHEVLVFLDPRWAGIARIVPEAKYGPQTYAVIDVTDYRYDDPNSGPDPETDPADGLLGIG